MLSLDVVNAKMESLIPKSDLVSLGGHAVRNPMYSLQMRSTVVGKTAGYSLSIKAMSVRTPV